MMFISEYYMKEKEGDTTTGFRVLHLTEKWKNIQILGRECQPVQTDQLGITRNIDIVITISIYERVRYLRRLKVMECQACVVVQTLS